MTEQLQNGTEFNLFPLPSRPPLQLKSIPPPRVWAGRNPKTTKTVTKLLAENYRRWDIIFDDRGFHNHTAHTLLASWSLGGNEVLLNAFYENQVPLMRPLVDSPSEITRENWPEHLGDWKYYKSYCTFFAQELKEKGVQRLLEEYVCLPQANFIPGSKVQQPEMLNRMLDAIGHPMLHLGYGLEFNIPGLVVEGIAQAAIHLPTSTVFLPYSLFYPDATNGLAEKFASSTSLSTTPKAAHALDIIARILKDPKLGTFQECPITELYDKVILEHGETINEYTHQWDLSGDVEKKVEELIWTMSALYGVGGYDTYEEDGRFNADFFTLHFVTSSIFVPSWVAHLTEDSARLFLRVYFGVCIAWYIGRGRPALNIQRFFSNPSTLRPNIPGPVPTPFADSLGLSVAGGSYTTNTNPWLPLIQSGLAHPDEHVVKLQRTLAYFDELFGHVDKGHFKNTELEGAEHIDGTLFLRTAVLTATRTGWAREDTFIPPPGAGLPSARWWDRRAFYKRS